MANEVNIKITADDKASPKIKELGSRAERTADKLRSMRGPLLAITGALTAVGTVGVKNASDLGESINAVEVVFKDASKTITDFSEIAATQAGLSMEAFNSQAVLTGSLLQNFGLSADESAEQTVRLAKRASDLASVFNTDVEQAMGAINAALRGETEQIRRFAVSIDDATLKNKAMAMGLADSEGEITRSAKSLAALELVMEQSADVQGDFINTSDSLANSTRIMKADFTNVSAELGQNLLPIATTVVAILADMISFFGGLDESTQKIIVVTGAFVAALATLGLVLPPIIGAFMALKTAALALNVAMSANPVGAVVAVVMLLATVAIPLLIANFDTVKEVFLDLANNFMASAEAIANQFIDLINIIIRGINQINLFGEDIDELGEVTFTRFGKSLDKITEKTDELGDALKQDAEEIKSFANITQEAITNSEDELNEALKMDFEEREQMHKKHMETLQAARVANRKLEKKEIQDQSKTFKELFDEQLRLAKVLPPLIETAEHISDPLARAFRNFQRGSQVSEHGEKGRIAQERMTQLFKDRGGFGSFGQALPMLPGMDLLGGTAEQAKEFFNFGSTRGQGSGGGGFQKQGDVQVFVEGDIYGEADLVNKVADAVTSARSMAIIEPESEFL